MCEFRFGRVIYLQGSCWEPKKGTRSARDLARLFVEMPCPGRGGGGPIL